MRPVPASYSTADIYSKRSYMPSLLPLRTEFFLRPFQDAQALSRWSIPAYFQIRRAPNVQFPRIDSVSIRRQSFPAERYHRFCSGHIGGQSRKAPSPAARLHISGLQVLRRLLAEKIRLLISWRAAGTLRRTVWHVHPGLPSDFLGTGLYQRAGR